MTPVALTSFVGGCLLIYSGWTRQNVLDVLTGIFGSPTPNPTQSVPVSSGASSLGTGAGGGGGGGGAVGGSGGSGPNLGSSLGIGHTSGGSSPRTRGNVSSKRSKLLPGFSIKQLKTYLRTGGKTGHALAIPAHYRGGPTNIVTRVRAHPNRGQ